MATAFPRKAISKRKMSAEEISQEDVKKKKDDDYSSDSAEHTPSVSSIESGEELDFQEPIFSEDESEPYSEEESEEKRQEELEPISSEDESELYSEEESEEERQEELESISSEDESDPYSEDERQELNKKLYLAARDGKVVEVTKYLNTGAMIDYHNPYEFSRTPLHIASEEGKVDVVQLLLDRGASLTAVNMYNRTPLHTASEHGRVEVVQLLLDRGASLTAVNEDKKTALHIASMYDRENVAKLLIDRGAPIAAVNKNEQTALHIALMYGYENVAKLLIERGAPIAAVDKYNMTPLHTASEHGRVEVVQLLLDRGASLTAVDEDEQTALHIALMKGHENVAKLLIDRGAPIAAVDKKGQTALHIASLEGHEHVAKVLIERGAPIAAVDKYNMTPLHTASEHGRVEVVQLLLDRGASLTAVDQYEETALHTASRRGHENVAKLLIDRGAPIAAVDKLNRTPLHTASEHGSVEVVQLLLDRGASLTAVDKEGDTAAHVAAKYGYSEILSVLASKNKDLLALPNKMSMTPLLFLKQDAREDFIGDEYVRATNQRRKKCIQILKNEFNIGDTVEETSDDMSATTTESDKEMKEETDGSSLDVDEQRLLRLAEHQIKQNGKLPLRTFKSMFIGPPGVGKTITFNRLVGTRRNISLDGHSKSSGIEKPCVINLYHDANKSSVLIGKSWLQQSLEDQTRTYLHYMQQVGVSSSSIQSSVPPPHKSHSISEEKENTTKHTQRAHDSSNPKHYEAKDTSNQNASQLQKIRQLVQKGKWKKAGSILKGIGDITVMYIIDTGGQPEFFQILPLLLRGPSLSLVFMNLAQSLREPFEVTYRHQPNDYSPIKYTSSYTQLEMIHQILASLHSLRNRDQPSVSFLIGTYRDMVTSQDVNSMEVEIEASLKGTDLLCFLSKCFPVSEDRKGFIYPLDNLKGDESEIDALRKILTEYILKKFHSQPLPIPWGIFHLLLRHDFESRGLCKLQEAVDLGKLCGINSESDVQDVLKFFHFRFGTILYYQNVNALKDKVICDPNLVFRPITRVVAESFGANPYDQEIAERIRATGEIPFDFFEGICRADDPEEQIGTKATVELLTHHNVASEISNGDCKLFMPCLLRPCPASEEEVDIHSMFPAPLVFTFHPSGYQPIGFFLAFASKLVSNEDFILDRVRYRNKIGFIYVDTKVEILSTSTSLQVCIENPSPPCRCIDLRLTLLKVFNRIKLELPHVENAEIRHSFYCPNTTKGGESIHLAECLIGSDGSPRILRCIKCKEPETIRVQLERKHIIWFEKKINVSGHQSKYKEHDLTTVKRCVTNVLNKNFAGLRKSSQDSLQDLASHLFSANIISSEVNKDPSFEKMMSNFLAGLEYKDTHEDVLEFLELLFSSFVSVGGPLSQAVPKLRKEIEQSM